MTKENILVVEDEKALANVITAKLNKIGFGVSRATNVDDAMEILHGSHQDAVWLDHYLLGLNDGLELVSRMKHDEALQTIPVFIVSNSSGDDKISSYLKLGVQKYYVKADHSLSDIINDIKATIVRPAGAQS